MARARPEPRRAARAGGGAGPGQRRPGPAGGLLPRLPGDAGDPDARLRHPLRVRHLPAGDRRRLAGREDRQVAALRQSLGAARGPEWAVEVKLGGHTERYIDEHERPARALGAAPHRDRRALRHADPGLPRPTPPTRCGCGGPRRRSPSTSRPSTAATTTARSTRRSVSENITKVLYPERRAGAGQGAAARAAVLLRLLLAAGHAAHPARCRSIPLERFHEKFAVQLNDTHPVDRDRRADAPAGGRARHGLGRRPGRSPARPSPTPTTRCCRRRWSAGRCRCSRACCRGTWRSSTRSTRASSTRCACASSATRSASRACR